MSKFSPDSLTIWYEPPMKPQGVASGVWEVYSNISPGRSIGVLPTTPGPLTSWRRPSASVIFQ